MGSPATAPTWRPPGSRTAKATPSRSPTDFARGHARGCMRLKRPQPLSDLRRAPTAAGRGRGGAHVPSRVASAEKRVRYRGIETTHTDRPELRQTAVAPESASEGSPDEEGSGAGWRDRRRRSGDQPAQEACRRGACQRARLSVRLSAGDMDTHG